jgi:hypothetical protein
MTLLFHEKRRINKEDPGISVQKQRAHPGSSFMLLLYPGASNQPWQDLNVSRFVSKSVFLGKIYYFSRELQTTRKIPGTRLIVTSDRVCPNNGYTTRVELGFMDWFFGWEWQS